MDFLKTIKLGGYLLGALPGLWQSRYDDYREVANRRLKALVKHAYENVDLYRQRYEQVGVRPGDIQTVDDLEKLPIITKQDLIDGFPRAILARGTKPTDYRVIATSGSTGVPVRIYKDRAALKLGCLIMLFAHRAFRRDLGTKLRPATASIWMTSPPSFAAVTVDEMAELPHFLTKSYHELDVLDDPHQHLHSLARYKPDVIFTLPSVLRNMAIVARQEGLEVHQPKLLWVSGELMDENWRQVTSSVFGGEIIECYATAEAGPIAMECRYHQGLHVLSYDVILEVLQDGKPVPLGVPGKVVVTDLRNRSTPIIRYSGLGDVAVLSAEKCGCGSKLPLLKVVEGRIVDSFILPNGHLLHPFSLTKALGGIPMIARFQIIQEAIDRVRTLIIPMKNSEAAAAFGEGGQLRNKVLQNLKEVLGEGIYISIDLVQEIPKSHEAKYQGVVRSLVRKDG